MSHMLLAEYFLRYLRSPSLLARERERVEVSEKMGAVIETVDGITELA
jgi:hypothetical protein